MATSTGGPGDIHPFVPVKVVDHCAVVLYLDPAARVGLDMSLRLFKDL
jgi:hypothetical protein